jgi:RHH-type proline utilization regulon transcriptional repressor/proline dehydrogenase/delta 1-pyrroline-5-carboxylate dehydrogenase
MNEIFNNKYISQISLTKEKLLEHVSSFSKKKNNEIINLALKIVTNSKKNESHNNFNKLIQEFTLTSREGICLMCLAETLIRIPDAKTINDLIEDKLPVGDWKKHISNENDVFTNFSSIAFLLTGKLVEENEEKNKNILGQIIKKLSAPILRKAIKSAINILAKQFVFEQDIQKAIALSDKKKNFKYKFSFDMLGEAAATYEDASRYYKDYENAIIACGNSINASEKSISVKLSSLHPRYERNQLELLQKELLPKTLELVKVARDNKVDICFDAEESSRLNLSTFIFKNIIDSNVIDLKYQGFGFAVQSYQKRAVFLLEWLNKYLINKNKKIKIRLVKGAYWDTEIKIAQENGYTDYPVFTKKFLTDISYLACAHKLFENDSIYPQFATHNAHTISYINTLFENKQFEYQKLHGMGDEIYSYFENKDNFLCRVYAPVGHYNDLLPYLVRRLLENGANSSFIYQLNTKGVKLENLVQSPLKKLDKINEVKIPLPKNIFSDRINSSGLDTSEEKTIQYLNIDKKKENFHAYSIVDGKNIKNDTSIDIISPYSDVILGKKYYTNEDTIEKALSCLKGYSYEWKNYPVEKRCLILEKFADELEANFKIIIEACVKETGKTVKNSIAEIREAIDFCRYYSMKAREIFKETSLEGPTGEKNTYKLKGKGLTFAISPWNFPVAIFIGQIVAALVAGNVVFAKPAEQSCYVSNLIINFLLKAGLPKKAISLILGHGKFVGDKVLQDEMLKNILFTGSLETAKIIQKKIQCKSEIPTFIAETGGLNCMIADSSSLPEHVIKDVLRSSFDSAGQRCSSCRILCVDENIYETIKLTLIGAMKTLTVGNPEFLSTDIGPVIDKEAYDNIKKHISNFKKVFSADLKQGIGNFISPTLIEIEKLSNLKNETFGPVLHLIKYKTNKLEELCLNINKLGFGLTLGIHSRIDKTIKKITSIVDVGNIYINRDMVGAVVGVQPFGGNGKSGTGPKAGGPEYLKRLCIEQSISDNIAATGGDVYLLSQAED